MTIKYAVSITKCMEFIWEYSKLHIKQYLWKDLKSILDLGNSMLLYHYNDYSDTQHMQTFKASIKVRYTYIYVVLLNIAFGLFMLKCKLRKWPCLTSVVCHVFFLPQLYVVSFFYYYFLINQIYTKRKQFCFTNTG